MIITDLRYLEWSKTRDSSGTTGSYLKSYSIVDGIKKYYKLSFFDDVKGVFGYESINEAIVSKLLDELDYNHVKYDLSYSKICIDNKEYITYVASSLDYKRQFETKTTFENFYDLNKNKDESIMDFIMRYGFSEEIYKMIIVDYLICNRDRHGANIEVLYNTRTKSLRLSPLYDHGLSFLSPSYLEKDIISYDIKKEIRVNSFIGSTDLTKNLDIVPTSFFPVNRVDFDKVINSLEIDEIIYLNKVKELLKWRWMCLENIRNKRQS